jgi:hypothetical protein
MVLVVDQTLTIVSRSHGAPSSVATPAQMSTTGSPSMVTDTAAPRSSPRSKAEAKAARTGAKRSSQWPWTSVMVGLLVQPPWGRDPSHGIGGPDLGWRSPPRR